MSQIYRCVVCGFESVYKMLFLDTEEGFVCIGEHGKPRMHDKIAARVGLEVGESRPVEIQGRSYRMTRTQ